MIELLRSKALQAIYISWPAKNHAKRWIPGFSWQGGAPSEPGCVSDLERTF